MSCRRRRCSAGSRRRSRSQHGRCVVALGPGRRPKRRHWPLASRAWRRRLPSFARAGPRRRGRCSAARASGRSKRARRAGSASSPAPPVIAIRSGAASARGPHRRAPSATGCVRLLLLRQALHCERRSALDDHRDRCPGPQTPNRPSPVAPDVRPLIVAPGSVLARDRAPMAAIRYQRTIVGTRPAMQDVVFHFGYLVPGRRDSRLAGQANGLDAS